MHCKNVLSEFKEQLFLFIVAFSTITVASKSSFLYPMNDWVDANCFFTVGKSMLYGLVPYKDLCELKGPLLYIVHMFAALFSKDSFLGVYFIEIACCFLFLYYLLKLLKLYTDKNILIFFPIISAIIYTSPAFTHGDSVEELCFPLLIYSLFVTIKSLRDYSLPNLRESFIIGITAGIILWMKFTICGFYIGLFIVPLCFAYKTEQLKNAILLLFVAISGILCVTVPILAYFYINNALSDLFEVYFYYNLFLYPVASNDIFLVSLICNLWNGLLRIIDVNIITFLLIILGILYCKKIEKRVIFLHYLMTLLFLFTFVYIGGKVYRYYALIFSVFTFYGILYIYAVLNNFLYRKKYNFSFLKSKRSFYLYCIGIFIALLLTPNSYLLLKNKSDLPQYKVKEIIEKSGIKNPTLLNYNFLDGGFYTVCNIIPTCKFFCTINRYIPDMQETQERYLREGEVDFVVANNIEISFDHYILIDSFTFYLEGVDEKYNVYALRK